MDDWDVGKWLNEIGLEERYAQSFIDNGYELPNLCANLKDEDLDAIEVSQEDRNEIFEHVGRLRHWSVARKPINFDNSLTTTSTIPNGNTIHCDDSSHTESSSTEFQQQPTDSLGASNELSVKSPDSLRSVSNELPDQTPPSKTEESEADCKPSTVHAPKKPPRSFKHRVPPPPLPINVSSQSQGLSKLQLKLKLKQELQQDHIVITEHPYVQDSGELNSNLLQQLAVTYAEQFSVDSLEVYEALAELWRVQTNRTEQATPKAPELLSPGHKITPVQKPATAHIVAYMDPYNGPPSQGQRRHPPPLPRRKVSSDKGSTKSNGSTTKTPSSSAVTSPRTSLDSMQMASEVFLYEDVDGLEDNGRSRESSAERDVEVSPERKSFLKCSESVPSFATHLAVDKAPGKKKGFRKFLLRSSKKKSSLPTISSQPASTSDLQANSITMSDEKRLELMEKFKNNELSENEVLNQETTPPVPPRSLDMMLSNGVAGHGPSNHLSVSNGNLMRAKSSEAIDNTSLTSSGSSGELDHPAVSNKPSTGVIASALKLFRKKRDSSFKGGKNKLSHSSSMPAIVIDGMLNEQNLDEVPKKSGKMAPTVTPSAYSEVFDRVAKESCSQTTSLPRSNASNSPSSSSSSSTSTLPSPNLVNKHSPASRYQSKKQQKLNANKNNSSSSKRSPLVKQSNPEVRKERMSSPPVLMMYPVKERSVETQEDVPMYADVWDKLDKPVTSPTSITDNRCDTSKLDSVVSTSTHDTDTTTDTVHSTDLDKSIPLNKPQLPDKPAISSRPKLMPKPALPRKPNIHSTVSVPPQPTVVDRPVSDVPVRPIPRPRSRGDSYCDMRRSQSPQVSDVFGDQGQPPEKPPRRRSTQCYSGSSRSDTPSPLGTRMTPSPLLTADYTANGDVIRPPLQENKPALPPKPKPRLSSSSTVGLEPAEVQVADRLAVDRIDLAEPPYSTTWGECGLPVPLITRYAYELNTSFDQMTLSLDAVRKHRLEQCQRVWVPMDKEYTSTHTQKPDTTNVSTWLASIGLPMYQSQLEKCGVRTLDGMRKISRRTFDQIQFRVPSHSQLLHKAIESLRNEY